MLITSARREENIRRSVAAITASLRNTKRIDVFENGRIDPTRPIEHAIRVLKTLVQEGLFDHVAMCECGADTLRRANAVHPVASVEIEVSPFSYEAEAQKGGCACVRSSGFDDVC
jgi:pyridoxine 4-dehydrogenase